MAGSFDDVGLRVQDCGRHFRSCRAQALLEVSHNALDSRGVMRIRVRVLAERLTRRGNALGFEDEHDEVALLLARELQHRQHIRVDAGESVCQRAREPRGEGRRAPAEHHRHAVPGPRARLQRPHAVQHVVRAEDGDPVAQRRHVAVCQRRGELCAGVLASVWIVCLQVGACERVWEREGERERGREGERERGRKGVCVRARAGRERERERARESLYHAELAAVAGSPASVDPEAERERAPRSRLRLHARSSVRCCVHLHLHLHLQLHLHRQRHANPRARARMHIHQNVLRTPAVSVFFSSAHFRSVLSLDPPQRGRAGPP
eukprot:3161791-Rhodomonas_salina.1